MKRRRVLKFLAGVTLGGVAIKHVIATPATSIYYVPQHLHEADEPGFMSLPFKEPNAELFQWLQEMERTAYDLCYIPHP